MIKEVDLNGEWVLEKSVPFSKSIRDIYLLASDNRIEKVVVRNDKGEVSEENIRLR